MQITEKIEILQKLTDSQEDFQKEITIAVLAGYNLVRKTEGIAVLEKVRDTEAKPHETNIFRNSMEKPKVIEQDFAAEGKAFAKRIAPMIQEFNNRMEKFYLQCEDSTVIKLKSRESGICLWGRDEEYLRKLMLEHGLEYEKIHRQSMSGENQVIYTDLNKEPEPVKPPKLYWPSVIICEAGEPPWLCANSTGSLSKEEALETVNRGRKNFNVISAWIDTFDEENNKTVVFHECYLK